MKTTTKSERVQPVCTGVDERGELVWEGRAMEYWQMAMFPVRYAGDFLAHWTRMSLRGVGLYFDEAGSSMDISEVRRFGKKRTERAAWGD